MELTHDFVVPAPIDVAWETFMDLERVGGCFPGAIVTESTGDTFAGTVKVKLGPIALQYAGSGQFLERDDSAHRAVIEAKGKDKRGNGTAGAMVTLQLTPAEGGSSTRIDVTTELAITGKPAQFGRGVMQDVSDKLLQQFVGCIESQFDAMPDQAPVARTGAEPTAASGNNAGGSSEGAEAVVRHKPDVDSPTPSGLAHGMPLAQYREEVADDEGMALSPAEIAEGLGEVQGSGTTAAFGNNAGSAGGGAATAAAALRHTGPLASPSSPSASSPPTRPKPAQADDSIDLGATVLPVLLKSYAPHLVGALVAIALGYALGRRRR